MKTGTYLILLVLLSLTLPHPITIIHAHSEHVMVAPDHCENPTQQLTISASASDDNYRYDKEEYYVKKNTCYQLFFKNNDTLMAHDLNIDAIESELELVHIHVMNNTDGPEGNGIKSMNIKTPDKDTTYRIYCTIGAHEELGMHALLIVGKGGPNLMEFRYSIFIILFVSLPITIPLIRKRFD